MALWSNLAGTVLGYIRLGLTGPRLKNSSGTLAVRNAGDTADASVSMLNGTVAGTMSMADAHLTTSSTNSTHFELINTATSGRTWVLYSSGGGPAAAGTFGIYDDTASANRLTIGSAGDVGIGTAAPAYDLDIRSTAVASQVHVSSSSADSGLYITSASASNGFMSMGAAYSVTGWVAKATSASLIGGGSGAFRFYTDSGLTAESAYTPTERMSVLATGEIIFKSPIGLKGYTVATLPAGTQGYKAYVTDALAPTYLVTVAGGGAVVTEVFYNGTNWVCT